jgi:hypothetical protein
MLDNVHQQFAHAPEEKVAGVVIRLPGPAVILNNDRYLVRFLKPFGEILYGGLKADFKQNGG